MSFATSTRSLLHYFSDVEHYGADRSEHSPGVGYYHQEKGKREGGAVKYMISHITLIMGVMFTTGSHSCWWEAG